MLYGKYVKLRYYEPEDLDFLVTLRGSKDSYKYFFEFEPYSKNMQKEWWENSTKRPNEKNFIIADIKTNKAIGTIALVDIDMRNKRAEFGRYYVKGNSLESIEAVYLLVEYGFEHLNLNNVFCLSFEKNKSVVKQHEKFGFMKCGILKEYIYHDGKYENVVFQCLLKREYDKIKNKLKKILFY